MFWPDQSDSVVMDSLARRNEARPVAMRCDFSNGVGHPESQACEIVAWVRGVPFVSQAKEIEE